MSIVSFHMLGNYYADVGQAASTDTTACTQHVASAHEAGPHTVTHGRTHLWLGTGLLVYCCSRNQETMVCSERYAQPQPASLNRSCGGSTCCMSQAVQVGSTGRPGAGQYSWQYVLNVGVGMETHSPLLAHEQMQHRVTHDDLSIECTEYASTHAQHIWGTIAFQHQCTGCSRIGCPQAKYHTCM